MNVHGVYIAANWVTRNISDEVHDDLSRRVRVGAAKTGRERASARARLFRRDPIFYLRRG